MGIIEKSLVFSMTALNFSIVPGRIWADELVSNPQLLSRAFKKGQFIFPAVGKAIGKFKTVIRLNALDLYA